MFIKSNTDLMQSKFRPCTYSTYVRYDMIDLEEEAKEQGCDIDNIDIDHDAFKKDLSNRLYGWFIENLNPELPDRIQFVSTKVTMVSPQYYNYGTDNINIKLKVLKKPMQNFIEENKEKLNEFLKKYESHSGFISFTPSSYWALTHEEDIERVVMCVLDFLLTELENKNSSFESPAIDCPASDIIYPHLTYPCNNNS